MHRPFGRKLNLQEEITFHLLLPIFYNIYITRFISICNLRHMCPYLYGHFMYDISAFYILKAITFTFFVLFPYLN